MAAPMNTSRLDSTSPDEPDLGALEEAQARAKAEAEHADEAARLGTSQARRLVQHHARRFSLVGIGFSVVLSLLLAVLVANLYSQQRVAEAQQEQSRRETTTALESLNDANRLLQARGQRPVTPPPTDDPSEVIAAAVTARVVGQLPPAPTPQQVAAVILPTLTANPTGPAPDQLTAAIGRYFAAAPPPVGPPGRPGEPGRGPTQAQIDAAVADAYRANPPPPGPAGAPGSPGTPGAAGGPGGEGPMGPMGPAGMDGRSITGSVQDPEDPCTRIFYYSKPPVEERINTCPPAPVVPPEPSVTPTDTPAPTEAPATE